MISLLSVLARVHRVGLRQERIRAPLTTRPPGPAPRAR